MSEKISQIWSSAGGIRHIVSLVLIMVAGGIGWGSITSNVEMNETRNLSQDEELKTLSNTVDHIKESQSDIKTDVEVTKMIVERIERKLDKIGDNQ